MNNNLLFRKVLMCILSYIVSFFVIVFIASIVLIPVITKTGNIIKTEEEKRIALLLYEYGLIEEVTSKDLIRKISNCDNGDVLYLYCNASAVDNMRKYVLFSLRKPDNLGEAYNIVQAFIKESEVKINPMRVLFQDEIGIYY